MDEHLSLIDFQVFLLCDFKFGQMSAGRKAIGLKVELVFVCVSVYVEYAICSPRMCLCVHLSPGKITVRNEIT